MSPTEGPIEARGTHTQKLAVRRRTHVVAAWVMVWLAAFSSPSVAAAQADYSGPAVVPPAEVYVNGRDGQPKPSLPRWHTGTDAERTLWVYFTAVPPGRPGFWEGTLRAMETWNAVAGVPLVFRSTAHAGAADVEFRWIRRFDGSQAGTTDWETDGSGWLSSTVVTLATEHEGGRPMSDEFVRMVSLHELGHVVGLPHSDDPNDVMHPGNHNLSLSDRDIRSARQLYERLESEKVSVP